MKSNPSLTLNDFDFNLPAEQIAQQQISNKNNVKLLEVTGSKVTPMHVSNIVALIKPQDVVIVNNTKVIKSRIVCYKDDKKIVLTLHKLLENNICLAFAQKSKKIKSNDTLLTEHNKKIKVIDKLTGGELKLDLSELSPIEDFLENHGFMPLPPYIKRNNINDCEDTINYQSIFASKAGAVAAPTASFHFTQHILNQLKNQGTTIAEVTLHVGAATFLPVKTHNIQEHKMHYEYGEISQNTADIINNAKSEGKRIIAVGTTALRILEHVASNNNGSLVSFKGETNLFIYPGFNFKVVDVLITNFHTPKSTLLMLVSAFAGTENIKKAYDYAIKNGFRFFSYGDCTFLHKNIENKT